MLVPGKSKKKLDTAFKGILKINKLLSDAVEVWFKIQNIHGCKAYYVKVPGSHLAHWKLSSSLAVNNS